MRPHKKPAVRRDPRGDFPGYKSQGDHYKGSCQIWMCLDCKGHYHAGSLQAIMDSHECPPESPEARRAAGLRGPAVAAEKS